MNTILICPVERPGTAFLAQSCPLVTIPVMGQALIEYWLEALAGRNVKEVLVLATDRPEQVRSLVGNGSRWGIKVMVAAELHELSPAEALAKYSERNPHDAVLIDHFPALPEHRLFDSYESWMTGLKEWIPLAAKTARVGWREARPGIWIGRRSHVASSAELRAPCWIGENVQIGPDAQVGPGAIIENCAVIERAAEVVESYVGPETFVGTLTKLNESIAWGNTLIDWRTGSCIQVPDAFLLSPLGQRSAGTFTYFWTRLSRAFHRLVRRPAQL